MVSAVFFLFRTSFYTHVTSPWKSGKRAVFTKGWKFISRLRHAATGMPVIRIKYNIRGAPATGGSQPRAQIPVHTDKHNTLVWGCCPPFQNQYLAPYRQWFSLSLVWKSSARIIFSLTLLRHCITADHITI